MAHKILVETSARHLHVTPEHLEILFGKGHELTPKKYLSQPGQFASEERVTIVGPKRELKNISILGPCRKETQIELALTEARQIGVVAPVRESGVLEGTPGCKLVGPAGEVEIDHGIIAAMRHIHLDPKTAEEYGLKDKDMVSVQIDKEGRALTFGDVIVRVSENYSPAMHIDTDESNACGGATEGIIIKD